MVISLKQIGSVWQNEIIRDSICPNKEEFSVFTNFIVNIHFIYHVNSGVHLYTLDKGLLVYKYWYLFCCLYCCCCCCYCCCCCCCCGCGCCCCCLESTSINKFSQVTKRPLPLRSIKSVSTFWQLDFLVYHNRFYTS